MVFGTTVEMSFCTYSSLSVEANTLKAAHILNSISKAQGDGEQSKPSNNQSTQHESANVSSRAGFTSMTCPQTNPFSSGNGGDGGDGGDGGGGDERRPCQRNTPSPKIDQEEKEEKEREESEEEGEPMEICCNSGNSMQISDDMAPFFNHSQRELEPSDCSMPSAESLGHSYIYESGHIMLNGRQFKVRTILGQGAFGICALVIDYSNEELLAMKQIHREYFKMDEVHIMTKLQGSPYVIQLHGCQELVNYFRLFMDYAQGGDLHSYLSSYFCLLNAMEKFKLFQDIMEGVRFVHSNSIVHADIKSQNILLMSGNGGTYRAVLCDYGLSLDTRDNQYALIEARGTIRYRSPELCRGSGQNSFSSDIWACGCVLMELDTGIPPWKLAAERGEGALIFTIGSARQPPIPENASDVFRRLYSSMLALVPENRKTALQICEMLTAMESRFYEQ